MKRAAPWDETYTISSDDSSDSDSDDDPLTNKKGTTNNGGHKPSKGIMSEELSSRKKKMGGMDFEALSRHGYHGGPSVLKVPPPRMEERDQDRSWSTGTRGSNKEEEEPYEERERTRAVSQCEGLLNLQSSVQVGTKDKNMSFSQKEKRKRDSGQASRGKNYVEEEKRLLRDSGVYSGFDDFSSPLCSWNLSSLIIVILRLSSSASNSRSTTSDFPQFKKSRAATPTQGKKRKLKKKSMTKGVHRVLLFIALLLLSRSFNCDAKRVRNDRVGGGAIDEITRKVEKKRAPPSTQEAAAMGLLQRLLPSHLHSFYFKVQDVCRGTACFRITNVDRSSSHTGPEIMIEGTTAVEVAAGLHWYLKYWCGAHISWDKTGGSQLGSVPPPGSLPPVDRQGVLVQRPVPLNYYQNVVTSSYSYVWWDWKRWEKEIDWMALQGVNLPLAFTGQEAIWQKVYKEFNISSESLDDFFGGPAFLSWARMGNLHAWGGPLSQNWLDQQLHLQKHILSRMIDLGMTPVLPSFSGNVPAVFRKIYPSAKITRLGDWNTVNGDPRWCCTFLLDPSDPLFVEVGEAFIKQQVKEYGDVTDIYNCDTFSENEPPTDDPSYISSLGAAVYKAMSKGDADAIWLMQGWLFSSDSTFWKPPQMKAILHSVPIGKLIVLDLFAEVKPIWKISSHFYGVPYVWCMLHNFGANIEMYGRLNAISSGPIEAHVSQNSTMVGVGMCMEGIEQNPVVYELMSEMAFRSDNVQLEEWLKSYSYRRYGREIYQMEEAWKILYHTIYNCTDEIEDHNTDYIVKFPDTGPFLKGTSRRSHMEKMITHHRFSFREINSILPEPHLWYLTEEAINALKLFLVAGNDLRGSLTFRYDLVDLTRQVLAKLANQVYHDAMAAYVGNNASGLTLQSQKFVELIEDMDSLLASDDNFLLGTWLESAKSLAANQEARKQYEWNARTQVSMWYDTTRTNQSKLHDYANKYWSGLLKNYYLPRASTYFNYLSTRLKSNTDFPLEKWNEEWISYSNKWQAGEELYAVKAEGDALAISTALFHKYLS